jgi:hypothetical protein
MILFLCLSFAVFATITLAIDIVARRLEGPEDSRIDRIVMAIDKVGGF